MVFVPIASLALAVGVGAQSSAATSDSPLPDGPSKALVLRTCGTCHDPTRAASVRLTADGWSEVLADMIRRGAKMTDEEQQQVFDYLTTNFLGEAPKPININSATAIDFESVLGLLRKEAASVIAYREKNGAFKAIADMKKVPGLDYKKVDTQKDRIVCF
jgi:competence protein ComEA